MKNTNKNMLYTFWSGAILYGHLKNVTLKPGDTVKQGEKLGECSDSGDTWAAGVGVIYYSASTAK